MRAEIKIATVQCTDFPYHYWDAHVFEDLGERGIVTKVRKAFGIGAEKSKMLDWATNAGAEEVTFKL